MNDHKTGNRDAEKLQEHSFRHFYIEPGQAKQFRTLALRKLKDNNWMPFDTAVKDILLLPNGDNTVYIVVQYSDDSELTLFEFMTANKLNWRFFDE